MTVRDAIELVVALAVIGGCLYGIWRDAGHWLHGFPHEQQEWPPCRLVHVAYDGEVIEYETSWEFPTLDAAETLGEIRSLPEVAA